MKRSEINTLQNVWLANVRLMNRGNVGELKAATAVAMLVFMKCQLNDDEELTHAEIESLKLALKIDMKSIDTLEPASKELIASLSRSLDQQTAQVVSTLSQAVQTLEQDDFTDISDEQKERVRRIFKGIEQFCQMQEAFGRTNIITYVVEGEKSTEFVFHGENYQSPELRKEVVNRLRSSLVSSWNQAVSINQLPAFLDNINAGLCVEGCTRDALEKLSIALTLENQQLATDFDATMASAYNAANNLLATLQLNTSWDGLQDIILSAYSGDECAPKAGAPTKISERSVGKYIGDLMMHDAQSIYHVDEPVNESEFVKKLNQALTNLSIAERILILDALFRFSPPKQGSLIYTLKGKYQNLLRNPKNLAEVRLYLGHLDETQAYDLTLHSDMNAVALAVFNRNALLLKALIAYKDCDMLAIQVDGVSLIHRIILNFNEDDLKDELFKKGSNLFDRMTPDILFEVVDIGNGQLTTLAKTLASSPSGCRVLLSLLQSKPEILTAMTIDTLCGYINNNFGTSLFCSLLLNESGIQILRYLFTTELVKQHEEIIFNILFFDRAYDNTQYYSLLELTSHPVGIQWLIELLKQNPLLMDRLNSPSLYTLFQGSAPHRPRSVFGQLLSDEGGRELLTALFSRGYVIKEVTDQFFSHILFDLLSHIDRHPWIMQLLQAYSGLLLKVQPVVYFEIHPNGESIFSLLFKSEFGRGFLEYSLNNKVGLIQEMSVRDFAINFERIPDLFDRDKQNFFSRLCQQQFTMGVEKAKTHAIAIGQLEHLGSAGLLMARFGIDTLMTKNYFQPALNNMSLMSFLCNWLPGSTNFASFNNFHARSISIFQLALKFVLRRNPDYPTHFNKRNFLDETHGSGSSNVSLFWTLTCAFKGPLLPPTNVEYVAALRTMLTNIVRNNAEIRESLTLVELLKPTDQDYIRTSALWNLLSTAEGLALYSEWLDTCPNIMQGMQTAKELSALFVLNSRVPSLFGGQDYRTTIIHAMIDKQPLALQKLMAKSPVLTQMIDAEVLFKGSKFKPALFSRFVRSTEGIQVLHQILLNNPALIKSLDLAADPESINALTRSPEGLALRDYLLAQLQPALVPVASPPPIGFFNEAANPHPRPGMGEDDPKDEKRAKR